MRTINTREEFRLKMRQSSLDWDMNMVDPQMVSFGNALNDVDRGLRTLQIQYRNADSELENALNGLKDAYDLLVKTYKNARRGVACIDDYVRYIRPDYVSVDNATGMTSGTTAVKSVTAEVDVDGIHMYVAID